MSSFRQEEVEYLDKLKKRCACLVRKPVAPYVNKTQIDEYVDNFWFFNCPDHYSAQEIDEKIRLLMK
jgi:hypothetical protein